MAHRFDQRMRGHILVEDDTGSASAQVGVSSAMSAVAVPPSPDATTFPGYPRFLQPRIAAAGLYYAGFWLRCGIGLMDVLTQSVLYAALNYVVQLVLGIAAGIAHFDADGLSMPISIGCALLVVLVYNLVLVPGAGASLGMRIVGARIVLQGDVTARPSAGRLRGRGVLWVLATILAPLALVDVVAIALDLRKRALHDLATGTVLVRRAPPPPRLPPLQCSVCGRAVQEGTLCGRHGGTTGITIALRGRPVALQTAAALLALAAVAAIIAGLVLLLSGSVPGVAGPAVGILLLWVTMALTQMEAWARLVASLTAVLVAAAALVAGLLLFLGGDRTGAYILVLVPVSIVITAALWSPQTHRAFMPRRPS